MVNFEVLLLPVPVLRQVPRLAEGRQQLKNVVKNKIQLFVVKCAE